MSEEQFDELSNRVRTLLREAEGWTGELGDDIFVHGSRGNGTAEVDSDLDIGIRVAAERFKELIDKRLVNLSVGSDPWDTVQMARERGRLHSGESGLSGVRKQLPRLIVEEMKLDFAGVQISVIRERGMFDRGPFIPLRPIRVEDQT